MVFRKISMRQMVSLDRMLDQIAFIASIEINFNCGIEDAFIGRMIYSFLSSYT